MAAAAISVISAPARSLLRIQSKFGIGLTPLDFTGHEHECYGGPKQIGTTALKGRLPIRESVDWPMTKEFAFGSSIIDEGMAVKVKRVYAKR
jgi:hypothetical protein